MIIVFPEYIFLPASGIEKVLKKLLEATPSFKALGRLTFAGINARNSGSFMPLAMTLAVKTLKDPTALLRRKQTKLFL